MSLTDVYLEGGIGKRLHHGPLHGNHFFFGNNGTSFRYEVESRRQYPLRIPQHFDSVYESLAGPAGRQPGFGRTPGNPIPHSPYPPSETKTPSRHPPQVNKLDNDTLIFYAAHVLDSEVVNRGGLEG
jgi:hypothetical protein